jgi:hypothetical protein
MSIIEITLPDEVDTFFKQIIGYEDSDYEFMLLSSLLAILWEYPEPFKAAKSIVLAITNRLNVIQVETS